MTFECTQEVANDLEKLLLNNDDYDVIIYAGENENIEEIYAHSNILRARSQYFHLAFSGKWIEKKNGKYIVKKSNISCNFFKIILRFIYCGRVDLTELQGPDIIKLLIATDEINISTLSDYIQKYLIKYNDKDKFLQSLIENLESVYQHENFTELWNFCLEKICMEPDILFKSDKFIRLEAPLLELVLKRGDLSIDEIIVWDNLIKWCLAQHTNISKDPEQWNKEEITIMKRTIRRFVSLIRFNRISSEDFILKVYPFKKIIPKDLINNITLNCFYQNDSLENLFEVDIDKNQSVIELEKILKTNLDLDKVSLRKVGILISTYKRDFVFESQNMESSQKICEYFGSSPDERYIHVLICQSVEATELKHESNEMEDKYSGLRGAFLDAYLSGYLKHGDSVEYEHMGKIYNGVFRTINKSLRLIIVDHDNPECKSFAEFIRKVTKVTDRSQRPSGNQYKKLKVKGLAWKDFCEKLRFIRSIALIKKELQYFLEDSNVRDVFFGNEFRELLKVNKLYVVVNDSPTKLLQNVGEFQIVYIVWGKFTEKVPRNLPPRKTLSPDIKKKFDELLDSTLGIEFSINHRNLIAISLGWKISKGLYTNTPAIVFYVIRKGVIPINSEIFPREICGIETDVREGFYNPCGTQEIHGVKYCQEYKSSVSPGCSIGITSCNTRAGTLGAFVENKNYLDDNIYLLSNDHVLRLKWDSETKSTIRQPAYCDYEGATKENIRAERNLLERAQYVNKNKEEIDERSENIDELKKKLEKQTRKKTELGIFVMGKRGNHDINEKTYGVDAAIALVNNPDRKRYICPKEFAVPDTVFENRSFEPIKISGIKDVHLILPSELVFKVGHTTGLTTGCIDDSLVSIVVDGDFSIYNQQSQILGEVLIDKIEMEGKEIFPSIRLDRQILVRHVDDEMFMKRGESGCTWFDQEGKIIALGHGVLSINNLGKDYSIGSPINAVLEALEIKLYLGE